MSQQLIEKVDGILTKAELPDRHTFFQIEKFIIGKEPTAQSQLWSIVRELQARKETIDAYKKDLADAEDNLELFDIKIERIDLQIQSEKMENSNMAALNIKECEINIRKLQREKEALINAARKIHKKLKCVLEEMAFLVSGFEKIEIKIGTMKPLDDEQSQKDMWNEKFLEEFNLRVILNRPLDPEFIKSVMCLHDEAPVKKHVIGVIENIQNKMVEEKRNSKKPEVTVKANITGK